MTDRFLAIGNDQAMKVTKCNECRANSTVKLHVSSFCTDNIEENEVRYDQRLCSEIAGKNQPITQVKYKNSKMNF